MPFVSIRIVEGHTKERKNEMARRVTEAIAEVAQVPKEIVWVAVEDIPAAEWYIGAISVEQLRKAAQNDSDA